MKPNNNTRKIAITGGIGSGKSTVAGILREKGFAVFSCDEIYKEVVRSDEYLSAMKMRFSTEYFDENGEIDRKKLAKDVFENEQVRLDLNAISHPLIMRRLHEYMENADGKAVFAEVPLLFESGFENMFDCVLVVFSEKQKRIECIKQRDGFRDDEIEKRIQSQFDYDSEEAKKRYADCSAYLLDNSGSPSELIERVEVYLQSL